MAVIDAGDEGGHIAATWVAAQELCAIYRCRDRDQAAGWLYDWTVLCIDSGPAELSRLARTINTPTSSPVAAATEAPKPSTCSSRKSCVSARQELPQLPTAPAAALRNHLAKSHANTTTRPTTNAWLRRSIKPRHHYEPAYHTRLHRANKPRSGSYNRASTVPGDGHWTLRPAKCRTPRRSGDLAPQSQTMSALHPCP